MQISLSNHETCCLSELFLPNMRSFADLCEVAELAYRVCKHSLGALRCHHAETDAVVHNNMRIGISVTGVAMSSAEQLGWLAPLYEHLRAFDVAYSARMGWPASVKLTTVKPSGTLSLLAGVTPGAHPAFSRFLVRRMRMASDSPLVELCRRHGCDVEPQRGFDGTEDRRTTVVSFPCAFPAGAVLARDLSALDQLELQKRLQTEWADNSVSLTVYYKREELPAVRAWLAREFRGAVKGVSFLLHSDHGFLQAPLEEISEQRYHELAARFTPITSCDGLAPGEDDGPDPGLECAGGACPVR